MNTKKYEAVAGSSETPFLAEGQEYETGLIYVIPPVQNIGSGLLKVILGRDAEGVLLELSHDGEYADFFDAGDEVEPATIFLARVALGHRERYQEILELLGSRIERYLNNPRVVDEMLLEQPFRLDAPTS